MKILLRGTLAILMTVPLCYATHAYEFDEDTTFGHGYLKSPNPSGYPQQVSSMLLPLAPLNNMHSFSTPRMTEFVPSAGSYTYRFDQDQSFGGFHMGKGSILSGGKVTINGVELTPEGLKAPPEYKGSLPDLKYTVTRNNVSTFSSSKEVKKTIQPLRLQGNRSILNQSQPKIQSLPFSRTPFSSSLNQRENRILSPVLSLPHYPNRPSLLPTLQKPSYIAGNRLQPANPLSSSYLKPAASRQWRTPAALTNMRFPTLLRQSPAGMSFPREAAISRRNNFISPQRLFNPLSYGRLPSTMRLAKNRVLFSR